VVLVLGGVLVARPVGATTEAPAAPLPDSMAVIGDSLSVAFDACCLWGARPEHSWASGSAPDDGVHSHYERLLAANPRIRGKARNFARVGARIADAPKQARQAAAIRAGYVTILIGGNDACTGSTATMTRPEVFRAQFEQTMATLEGLPDGARVFVATIPDATHLRRVLGTHPLARVVWTVTSFCPAALGLGSTAADRAAVAKRIQEYNTILTEVCDRYRSCRHDGGATFAYRFEAGHVSTLDYFHPSRAGQAALARLTWQHSWWPELGRRTTTADDV
jgi:lysophospholipase L1-like esterase